MLRKFFQVFLKKKRRKPCRYRGKHYLCTRKQQGCCYKLRLLGVWCNWQHNRFWSCFFWFESGYPNKTAAHLRKGTGGRSFCVRRGGPRRSGASDVCPAVVRVSRLCAWQGWGACLTASPVPLGGFSYVHRGGVCASIDVVCAQSGSVCTQSGIVRTRIGVVSGLSIFARAPCRLGSRAAQASKSVVLSPHFLQREWRFLPSF